jgi:uncharacterized membrane protein YedE/YeeE
MGFGDFTEVHKMFTFEELRLFLGFAVGVALSTVGFYAFTRLKGLPRKPLHPGSAVGGIIFGAGWALTGACPAVVWVQLGEGRMAALATLAGTVTGYLLYPRIHRRFFNFDTGSCV